MFICSPNNPTGNLIHSSDIEHLLNKFNGIVVIDEAYIDFSESNSWSQQIDKYPQLVVMHTFSKARGLASARVGMAFANPDIIQLINKVKPPYNVSALNQQAALNALMDSHSYQTQLESIINEKIKLESELKQLKLIEKVYSTQANFILVKVTDANEIYNQLVNQKIVIRNRHSQLENTLRITVGSPTENKELIEVLKTLDQ